jgi:predicted metal-dependent enzyme (double-stranded beta helix superfamily)
MFDLDRFIADCRTAASIDPTHKSVREILARAVSEPSAVIDGVGEPTRAEVQKLYRSEELTVLNVIWAPGMTIMPHNHLMWAVIGIYTGREDNIFRRRIGAEDGGKIEAAGARSLGPRDVEPLGRDIIHTVTNPLSRMTGAIHIYGGDFFAAARSEWDPETLLERPFNLERNLQLFEISNAAIERSRSSQN